MIPRSTKKYRTARDKRLPGTAEAEKFKLLTLYRMEIVQHMLAGGPRYATPGVGRKRTEAAA